jgi:hypothetical protein
LRFHQSARSTIKLDSRFRFVLGVVRDEKVFGSLARLADLYAATYTTKGVTDSIRHERCKQPDDRNTDQEEQHGNRFSSKHHALFVPPNDSALSRGPHEALGRDETDAGPSAPTLG